MMEYVLSKKYNANISMVTAFSKQITHFFGVNLIQQVIKNYKRRFALGVAEIFG
jgi:hypothetical protein